MLVGSAVTLSLAMWLVCARRNDPEQSAQPVITALNQYRFRYGHYPANLNELLDLRLLSAIPSIPSDLSSIRGSLDYFSDQDLDLFCLSHTVKSRWGGLGPAKVRATGYVSYLERWVLDEAGDFDLTDPLGAAMDRAGGQFRLDGSSRALDLFVRKVIYYCSGSSVYPSSSSIRKLQLLKALGKPEVVDVNGKTYFRYKARDKKMATYYFFSTPDSVFSGEYGSRVASILRPGDSSSPGELQELYRGR